MPLMKKIGLISDTHSYFNPKVNEYFNQVDEIWHAGDIGKLQVLDALNNIAPTKAVWGNIDMPGVRKQLEEEEIFKCEEVKVLMLHIAGYPGRYNKRTYHLCKKHQPDLVICGHSHILKVMRDHHLNHLHINPGAAGKVGIHKKCTVIRFEIDGIKIQNLEVIEFER